jgi:flagella basal body P-ring formation protein FlgA
VLFLAWLLVLPCHAAEPAAHPFGDVPGIRACGDSAGSMILRQGILTAIREEVLRRTSPDPVTIEENDLRLQACPPQGVFDSEFVITRAEYDAARDTTVFWLASSQKDNTLPSLIVTVHKQRSVKALMAKRDFRRGQWVSGDDLVEVDRSSGNVLLPDAELWKTVANPVRADASAKPVLKTNPDSVLLVKANVPSELVLLGKRFRGRMTVIPLESGRLGDEVRVRDPETRDILRATVTSRNQLEENF